MKSSFRLGVCFVGTLFALFALAGCLSPLNNPTSNSIANDAGGDSNESPSVTEQVCAPLPIAEGNLVHVSPSQSDQLATLVAQATSGTTLLLADGEYSLAGDMLWFSTPGVSLRSASGNPEAVVINGGYATTEIITVAASDVTIAEITVIQAYTHGIHVVSSALGSTLNTRIYRVHVTDSREQAIKINPHNSSGVYVDDGDIACSVLTLSDTGRPFVNPAVGGCYTGGVDAHQARGWTIRDNYFEGFWCPSGLSEHAVHFWRGSADNVVERNTFVNNARAIGFGLANSGTARLYDDVQCSSNPDNAYIDHYGGVIRNNVISNTSVDLFSSASGVDCSICLWSACDANVVHNTQYGTQAGFSSIEWRFSGSRNALIANNLVRDALRARDQATATTLSNLVKTDASPFVDASAGDFHVRSPAVDVIGQAAELAAGMAESDFDRITRQAPSAIGAFEYVP